jgi:hypothetical protein
MSSLKQVSGIGCEPQTSGAGSESDRPGGTSQCGDENALLNGPNPIGALDEMVLAQGGNENRQTSWNEQGNRRAGAPEGTGARARSGGRAVL